MAKSTKIITPKLLEEPVVLYSSADYCIVSDRRGAIWRIDIHQCTASRVTVLS